MAPGSLGTNWKDRDPPMEPFYHVVEMTEEALGANHGPGAPRMFSNAGREYINKYGASTEHFAKIGKFSFVLTFAHFYASNYDVLAAKNHKHSKNNPYSQFRDGWTVDQVMNAPKVTNELTKFMCSPTSDGGKFT